MARLNRDQAVEQVGNNYVLQVEGANVDYTGRVTGTDWVEFAATIPAFTDSESCKLTMYVMVSQAELDCVEELDGVDWVKAINEAEFEIF